MQLIKFFKYGWMMSIACACAHRHDEQSSQQQPKQEQPAQERPKPKTVSGPVIRDEDEKEFKVQSQPFDINGMHLQYQYSVKYVVSRDDPHEKVWIMDKKLIDLKRHAVVFNLWIENEDIRPVVNLADINNKKYSPANFDDVNFDGYKDLREACKPCSGPRDNIEFVYLFNRRTKRFKLWRLLWGVNLELDAKNKTVQSYTSGLNNGEFGFQEVKFGVGGVQLYRKQVTSEFLDKKNDAFKVIYEKYSGEKLLVHKKRIIKAEESYEPRDVIDEMTK
ncbi:XAC2610-related protein [Mucilaginibacter celer]|uniref:Lipoprotein n=1 Tax=Mucilaginibacter celer TaxID=2305508 RepID=A0A494VQ42_9SPHI|nr:hypothetical protein [Mucilaginibacter celer]AYL97617.1 hypothetical protein HYN43_020995 [Mucilaginibacter celer]